MASKVIVAEKLSRAINSIKEDADALSAALGVDSSGYFHPIKGDAPYQEMVRTEQLAMLLKAVRERIVPSKAVPKVETEPPAAPEEPAPEDLETLTVVDLKDRARSAGVHGFSTMHKDELVKALRKRG